MAKQKSSTVKQPLSVRQKFHKIYDRHPWSRDILEPFQHTLGCLLDMLTKAPDLPLSDPGAISKGSWIFVLKELERLESDIGDAKMMIFARLHGVEELEVETLSPEYGEA